VRRATQVQARTQQHAAEGQVGQLLVRTHGLKSSSPREPLASPGPDCPAVGLCYGSNVARAHFPDSQEEVSVPSSIALRLVEVTHEGLLAVDGAGRISYANPAVATLFSYPPAEVVGLALERLFPGAPKLDVQDASNSDSSVQVARRRDGSEFSADVLIHLIDNPTTLRAIVAVRDRSERDFLVQQTIDAHEEVERLRTANALTLLGIGHDFRQPLQALQLLADLLRRKASDAQVVSEAAGHFHFALTRLNALIEERLPLEATLHAVTRAAASADGATAEHALL
jgi:PAS domain S-box-containing protein